MLMILGGWWMGMGMGMGMLRIEREILCGSGMSVITACNIAMDQYLILS
jgi:hypothetical protein